MKKSQLRKIIRESIKELMTEQTNELPTSPTDGATPAEPDTSSQGGSNELPAGPNGNVEYPDPGGATPTEPDTPSQGGSNARCMQISTCWGNQTRYRYGTVNGAIPQVGQMPNMILMGRTTFITRVTNPSNGAAGCGGSQAAIAGLVNFSLYTGSTCCPHLCGTTIPNITPAWWTSNPNYNMTGMNNVGCSGNGPMCCGNSNYNPIQTSSNPNFTAITPQGQPLCSTVSQPTTGCDPNGPFPGNFNLQNWTNYWTNLPNFSSSNPNQPCNFICQRRNQWTAQLAAGGMGPAQTNMVACRLDEAENQYQIHNCANSSANNCP